MFKISSVIDQSNPRTELEHSQLKDRGRIRTLSILATKECLSQA